MGGPNLEVFKFALYVFFPVAMMVHYGDPEWYRKYVLPYRERIFVPQERLTTHIPGDQSTLRDELARIKAEKLARRLEREHQEAESRTDHV
ncbi:hypothetical protein PUNSTDRAFT_70056 [Punctularia strigosozonata HHB-11173 SS5]|uniref:uncharacterized protein n=1 Tax=Punctularia strigosozonata (strain HHB-11173) TaxID=741275 RepID=UPI0004417F24|nr:uncharacterized protein PUNSTDRAFT_70056 [Punctularia strigosozonata HHB-11173 SS5]EIN07807.1 hypothetical protein PUNSTDRAFT_70056 [Punctularia strigosozonata HHB-11173 SS5]